MAGGVVGGGAMRSLVALEDAGEEVGEAEGVVGTEGRLSLSILGALACANATFSGAMNWETANAISKMAFVETKDFLNVKENEALLLSINAVLTAVENSLIFGFSRT